MPDIHNLLNRYKKPVDHVTETLTLARKSNKLADLLRAQKHFNSKQSLSHLDTMALAKIKKDINDLYEEAPL